MTTQKTIFFIFLLIFPFSSLSFADWTYRRPVQILSNNIRIASQPAIQFSLHNTERALLYAKWTEKLFKKFKHLSKPPQDPFILTELPDSLFELTLQAGDFYFRDIPNKMIVYGIILDTWFQLTGNQKKSVFQYLNSENRIYLKDILNCYSNFHQHFRPLEFMRYHVRFTLREIYFISIQELIERPFLYYNSRYSQDIFFKTIVIPETYTFYRYLKSIYPTSKIFKIAQSTYNKQSWKKATGEEINESEKNYTDEIEKSHFPHIDSQTNFTRRLNQILKIYHTTTKKTLFSR